MKYITLLLLLVPILGTAQYGCTEILFKNDTFIVSVQTYESAQVVHVSEKLFNQEYSIRFAKHLVKSYHETDSFRTWDLGGRQILYLERNWIFLCEDGLYGLNCVNLKF